MDVQCDFTVFLQFNLIGSVAEEEDSYVCVYFPHTQASDKYISGPAPPLRNI